MSVLSATKENLSFENMTIENKLLAPVFQRVNSSALSTYHSAVRC